MAAAYRPTPATIRVVTALLGDLCTDDKDCTIPNSECSNGGCICSEGYAETSDRQECFGKFDPPFFSLFSLITYIYASESLSRETWLAILSTQVEEKYETGGSEQQQFSSSKKPFFRINFRKTRTKCRWNWRRKRRKREGFFFFFFSRAETTLLFLRPFPPPPFKPRKESNWPYFQLITCPLHRPRSSVPACRIRVTRHRPASICRAPRSFASVGRITQADSARRWTKGITRWRRSTVRATSGWTDWRLTTSSASRSSSRRTPTTGLYFTTSRRATAQGISSR